MKEYTMFAIVIALLAGVFYGTVYSEVAKAITGISTVIEQAATHD